MPKVYFIDVTNRDGVQAPQMNPPKFQKTMLNWYLSRLGIHHSEEVAPYCEPSSRQGKLGADEGRAQDKPGIGHRRRGGKHGQRAPHLSGWGVAAV